MYVTHLFISDGNVEILLMKTDFENVNFSPQFSFVVKVTQKANIFHTIFDLNKIYLKKMSKTYIIKPIHCLVRTACKIILSSKSQKRYIIS